MFPDGSSVSFRCNSSSPGFFAMEGEPTLTCKDGEWSSRIPFCRETSKADNFTGKST